jgi:hypothetical protein
MPRFTRKKFEILSTASAGGIVGALAPPCFLPVVPEVVVVVVAEAEAEVVVAGRGAVAESKSEELAPLAPALAFVLLPPPPLPLLEEVVFEGEEEAEAEAEAEAIGGRVGTVLPYDDMRYIVRLKAMISSKGSEGSVKL